MLLRVTIRKKAVNTGIFRATPPKSAILRVWARS
jgi:hypothetical protein